MLTSPLRIAFIGRYTEGQTGIVRSIYMGLLENGHEVHEINLSKRLKIIFNPYRNFGGFGPVYIKWEMIRDEVLSFKPDVIFICAGGLTFKPSTMDKLKKYCTVIGVTLSDPDVFPSVSKFASEFDIHTTNSPLSYEEYKKLGMDNTFYMPFGIDSRFFQSREPDEKYQSDVSIIGHYRPYRLEIAKELLQRFEAKIFGRGWPIPTEGPVYDEEWFKAMYSTNIIINFPTTGAGYTNVKVGVFEAAATGRLILTEYFEEMENFFEYDKEIVGYKDKDDLMSKIDYYIKHPVEARKIALAGQKRCMEHHTWKMRLQHLFQSFTLKDPSLKWEEID